MIADMNRVERADLQPYLDRLRALPFVRALKVGSGERPAGPRRADAVLRIRTPAGVHLVLVEVKRTNPTLPIIDGLLAGGRDRRGTAWMVLAPYIGPQIGRRLRDNDVNYHDLAGNCHLALGRNYLALIEGRRPDRRAPAERGVRGPGLQVLFAILARPELLNVPVRRLADAAGIGKTAAAEMLARLAAEGLVGADRGGRRLLRPRIVLDRWLAGYATVVRPRLLVGRYRTNDPDPAALEERLGRVMKGAGTWAWGGGAAAMRLTRHYRGIETVLCVQEQIPDFARRARALPARDGPLIVMKAPGRVAFEGVERDTVHPLLVYTELLAAGDERAREAAGRIWDRYLRRDAA
jgi:hypothetical protein